MKVIQRIASVTAFVQGTALASLLIFLFIAVSKTHSPKNLLGKNASATNGSGSFPAIMSATF